MMSCGLHDLQEISSSGPTKYFRRLTRDGSMAPHAFRVAQQGQGINCSAASEAGSRTKSLISLRTGYSRTRRTRLLCVWACAPPTTRFNHTAAMEIE